MRSARTGLTGGDGGQRVIGLLLAAGAGRRFGAPKVLGRDADGGAFADLALHALADGGCAEIVVVLSAEHARARRLLRELGWLSKPGVRTLVAEDWAEGMGAPLRAGLHTLIASATNSGLPEERIGTQPGALGAPSATVITLVDLPDVGAAVVQRVLARVGTAPEAIGRAVYNGRPGHPVVLGRERWATVAAQAGGDEGARRYLNGSDTVLVECADLASGRDVDRQPSQGG